MYADKNVAPRTAATSGEEYRPSDFPQIRCGVRLFGSLDCRAFRATTPGLMTSRIRLRSEVAADLRPLSAVVHHNQSLWR
jgi:hypothetical protein